MTTKKFEEFVNAIGKPYGIYPSREQWERMRELRARHVPFAVVLGRIKKRRYVEIKPNPRDDRAHTYAAILSGHLRRGSLVLYVGYKKQGYVYLCNGMDWEQVYNDIVPPHLRPRKGQVSVATAYKKKRVWDTVLPRCKYKPTDYAAPKSENPYRRRCPNHGFARTEFVHRVMDCIGPF